MSGPSILTIRPGVAFAPDAAASFRRAEHEWQQDTGRLIDVNSTYRDWDRQMSMHLAWLAWVAGAGPRPPHSRAVHPKYSRHCSGVALDTDDWTVPGFIAHMREHGWIRTAASDPTELHHFEYQRDRDQHRGQPAPTTTPVPAPQEDNDMRIFKETNGTYWFVAPGRMVEIRGTDDLALLRRLLNSRTTIGREDEQLFNPRERDIIRSYVEG